ncbi:MAG: hypothetical protein WA584_15785 [Pyrinomonadaceae bacterium]
MKHRLLIHSIYILLISLTVFLPAANAAPGDLDSSFSLDGFSIEAIGKGGDDYAYATVIQSDGKIIVAGGAKYGYRPNCNISRFNPNGSPDTSFGSNGKAWIRMYDSFVCRSVALQADGKIVATGINTTFTGIQTGAVVRFNANGSPDASFDGDGLVIVPGGLYYGIAVQTDGKIVVAGNNIVSNTGTFALLRYNTNGSLDTSFDDDGMVLTDIASGGAANAVTIQPDGKIVAAGSAQNSNQDFAVVRYNADGSLDTSFDGDGKVTTPVGANSDVASSVAVQTDGKIVASGYSGFSGGTFSVVRYNQDGSLDTTFDGDGKVTTAVSKVGGSSSSMAIQSDGKIVAAGYAGTGSGTVIVIIRYNTDGSLDTSFDEDGKVITAFFAFNDYAYGVAIQTDGKIVATGFSRTGSIAQFDSIIVRYNSDGSLDANFDGDGKLLVDIGVDISSAVAVAVQADGKIIAAGNSYNDSQSNFTLARYNSDGSLDATFDGDGIVITSFDNSFSYAASVAIQADGKIVAAGYSANGSPDFAVARYNQDGSLDTTFDGDGKVTTPVLNSNDYGNAVKIQSDGKIIVGGYSDSSMGYDVGSMVRYNTDGSLDTSFDGDGKLTTISPFAYTVNALEIQADGKIIAAGSANVTGSNKDFAVLRFNTNGSPDTSFDGDGKATAAFFNSNDIAYAVAIQPDGRIVAAGYTADTNFSYYALARFNSNGSTDTSFDGDGKVITFIGPQILGSGGSASALAIQPDGRIVAAGGSYISNSSRFTLVRYNADGSLNAPYGTGGITRLGENEGSIYGIALDSNGKAIVAGSVSGLFAVARVHNNAAPHAAPFDFDGDSKSDISIFRPSAGEWWYLKSSNGGNAAFQFGNSTDRLVPGDFTGDGKTDVAVWRPSTGEWFILRSEDNSYYSYPFGTNGDIPSVGDFEGDGIYDTAVFRPSTRVWYIRRSSDGGFTIRQFGTIGDAPAVADYDGDGISDIAIWRASAGEWWIYRSSDSSIIAFQFGNSSDKPVQGDYTGDAKADIAVFRPSTGEWFILRSEDYSYYSFPFGTNGDIPAPADYDGDSRFEAAVFRPSDSTWYAQRSTAGTLIQGFGINGDKPVPNAFVP